MSASSRATSFVNGSAFRDTLRKAYYDEVRCLEETNDYRAFGRFPCPADEHFFRVNYYFHSRSDLRTVYTGG
jgi:hypothetical protein